MHFANQCQNLPFAQIIFHIHILFYFHPPNIWTATEYCLEYWMNTVWNQTSPSSLISQEAASFWLSVGRARQTSCWCPLLRVVADPRTLRGPVLLVVGWRSRSSERKMGQYREVISFSTHAHTYNQDSLSTRKWKYIWHQSSFRDY